MNGVLWESPQTETARPLRETRGAELVEVGNFPRELRHHGHLGDVTESQSKSTLLCPLVEGRKY